jgi:cysteine synthase
MPTSDLSLHASHGLPGDALMACIGNTPLMPMVFPEVGRTVYGKCEFLNPSGSIKDRLARKIIQDAEGRGLLTRDHTILECSSGNTGIAFAMLGAARGYRVAIVMSDRASGERQLLIKNFGAELILFSAAGYQAGINLTHQMAESDSRYFLPRQFENPLNADDHEQETAVEILDQSNDKVDAFVSGYGTGGTLAGCARALRRANPSVKIVAMEPFESALLSGEEACCHWIEGIAGGFVPPLLREVSIDQVIKVSSSDAMQMARRLNREYGLLVGSSSGANVMAALQVAAKLPADSKVVTILCDRAERYFSTRLFA